MLPKILLGFSFMFLASCHKFPEGKICMVDAPRSRLLCYDMMRDLDTNGAVKPEASASKVYINSMTDLDRSTVFDPESWSNVKTWLRNSRDACQR